MTIKIKNPAAFDAPARAARAALDMLDSRKAAALAAGRFSGHLLSDVLPRVTRSKLLESLHADGVAESICTFDVLAGERATTHDGMWELVKRWGGSETGIVSADITTDGVVTAVYQHGDRADATTAASLRASEALRSAELDAHVVARKEFCVVSHGVVELHFSFVDGRLVTDPAPPADVLSETDAAEFKSLHDSYLASLTKLDGAITTVNAMIAEADGDEGEEGENPDLDAAGDELPELVKEVNDHAAALRAFMSRILEAHEGTMREWERITGGPSPKRAVALRDCLSLAVGDLVDLDLESDDGMGGAEYFYRGQSASENKELLATVAALA